MCTVTVLNTAEVLLITMNRDEAWHRAPEIPPRIYGGEPDTAWAGPRDSQAGGTWMGVNDEGRAACILNGYRPEDPLDPGDPSRPSRGTIVLELLMRGLEHGEVWRQHRFNPGPYASFHLLTARPSTAEQLTWTGRPPLERHPLRQGWTLLTSSSWKTEEVLAWRKGAFGEWLDDGEPHENGLPTYHLLERDGLEEWSPLMTRPWSGTRSITQVRISKGQDEAELRYWRRERDKPVDPHEPDGRILLPLRAGP